MFREPVVFVDIETTGGSYRNSRVLEVAAIRVEAGQIVREFHSLINPDTHVPTMITQITGITADDVVDAPHFEDIADELRDVLDGAVFIAHNVRFDYSFLKAEFALADIRFNPKLLCTVRLSRALYPHQTGHSLEKLIARHNIPVKARHRAMDDTMAIHYFAQLAYDEHGEELFEQAVAKQLKTQYLPAHLDFSELENIGNVPGVYIFKDEVHRPIYVGKSITLKKRVISHFQSMLPKEVKMSQQVYSVETIPTGSELAALLLESKLVKELQPLFNRMLRRQKSYAILVRQPGEYAQDAIISGNVTIETDL
jgi:DNA polymerase-3 subunit epsilon